MSKQAVLIGATGLVGQELLSLLLQDDNYSSIVVLARKSTGISHPKLKEQIGDLLDDAFFKEPISGDEIFCCVGTTQSKTPDLATYKHIDFGIPTRAALAGIHGGINKFLVISSMGANPKSKMFYSRTKGQMEEALSKLNLERLHIFRPSLLVGDRNEVRLGEKAGLVFMKLFGWLVPNKYKGIEADVVAKAMHNVANQETEKRLFDSAEIRQLAKS